MSSYDGSHDQIPGATTQLHPPSETSLSTTRRPGHYTSDSTSSIASTSSFLPTASATSILKPDGYVQFTDIPRALQDPVTRTYPIPSDPIDVADCLAREPLVWTFGGMLKMGKGGWAEAEMNKEREKEEKAGEFARVKEELRNGRK